MNLFTKSHSYENPIDAYTVTGPSETTYSKNGSPIAAGAKVLRLHPAVFKPSNTHFDVECYVDNPGPDTETIEIKIPENKKVYLKISDCERLHLSKKKLLKAKETKTFYVLWNNREPKNLILEKTVLMFDRIVKNHDANVKPGFLISKEMQILPLPRPSILLDFTELAIKEKRERLPEIPLPGLMKVLKIFFYHLHYKNVPATVNLNITNKHKKKYQLASFSQFIGHATPTEIFLMNLSCKYHIADGHFSRVFKVHNVCTGKFAALKESKNNKDAVLDVSKEIKNLELADELQLGSMQKPTYFSFRINPKQISYFGPFYNGIDLFEIMGRIPLKERIIYFKKSFTELIGTLSLMHEKRIFHNDIKPENLFASVDEKGVISLYFGDMGGLAQANSEAKEFYIGTHTPCFSPFQPTTDAYDLEVVQAFDVFQLGASFYTALTGMLPYVYDVDFDNYPDFQCSLNIVFLSHYCSPQAVDLIKSMCSPKMNFTAKQAWEIVSKPLFEWEHPNRLAKRNLTIKAASTG
jgi:hypothetical protein